MQTRNSVEHVAREKETCFKALQSSRDGTRLEVAKDEEGEWSLEVELGKEGAVPMWEGGSLCESGNGGSYRVGEKVIGEKKEKKCSVGAPDFLIVFSFLLIPSFLISSFLSPFYFIIITFLFLLLVKAKPMDNRSINVDMKLH